MAQHTDHAVFGNTGGFAQQPSLMARLVDLMLDWNDRARSRRQLAGLTEGELKDIGLNQSDVTIESSKPFWRF
ncbi:MAG: DUF1127 domain-containing protein [Rhodospirillales bacterium]|nr:DUF1127 domain-containing protein [Rhodospirillales bacterium]